MKRKKTLRNVVRILVENFKVFDCIQSCEYDTIVQPDFTTSMPRVSKKTAIKILTSFFLFGSLFLQPQSPANKEVKAEPCAFNSNVLDAKCKCQRNQCRLSKTGYAPQFNDSGANNDKNTSGNPFDSNFGSGEYDCFNGNETVLGKKGDLEKQKKYKAIFALTVDNAQPLNPETGGYETCSETLTYDQVQASRESRTQLEEYKIRYVTKDRLKDQSKDPCYLFDYGLQVDSTLTSYVKANDVLKDTFGLDVTSDTLAHCGPETFSFGVVGYRQDNGVTCRYVANFNPSTSDFTDTTSGARYSFSKNCILLAQKIGIGYAAVCDNPDTSSPNPAPTKEQAFYQKFYVDEFNRLPNNQNIPEGAVCKSIGGPNDGYAYWYYPKYFELVGGTGDTTTCEPILVKKDLFGRGVSGTSTFLGCLPNSVNGATAFFIRLAVGMAGFITLLVAVINLLKIIGSSNNPDAIAEARKKMVGAVVTFIFLLSSLTILSILGLKILDIGGLGGGIFKLFTGG